MNEVERRKRFTESKLGSLREVFLRHLGNDEKRLAAAKTCVYVVGSGGRGELSMGSDIDLFVARIGSTGSPTDADLVRTAIERALFDEGWPAPSQGGVFLAMHTSAGLVEALGAPEDDARNTFTARMLLLLESRPLWGEQHYTELLDAVIDAYFADEEDHQQDFQPYLLLNDVVRYWRSLLLNYAAKNATKARGGEGPADAEADRRLRAYKLRFSRCLLCFSFVAELIHATRAGAVERKVIVEIVRRSPIERLELVGDEAGLTKKVSTLVECYAGFLTVTSAAKQELRERFTDDEFRRARTSDGADFGKQVFELLELLSQQHERSRDLYRHVVV